MTERIKIVDKRKALLDATLHLVNNNGFHDAPMSKIAKTAGVSPGTIYLYFENKQDLINQLYIEIKKSFSKYAFNNYKKQFPVKKGFEIIWYNIANYKLSNIEQAMFLAQCDNTPMVDEISQQEGLKHLQPLIDLLEKGKCEGIIKPKSNYLLYAFTIYPLAFLMTSQRQGNYQLEKDNLAETFQIAWDAIKL